MNAVLWKKPVIRKSLVYLISIGIVLGLLVAAFGCSDDDDETTTVTVTTTTTTTPSAATTQPSASPTTGQTSTQTTTPTTAALASLKGKNVAYSCMGFAIQVMQNYELGMKAVFDPLGINLIEYDANFDVGKQISDIETAIVRDVDAIIITAVQETALDPVLAECRKAGIPTIGLTTSKLAPTDLQVGFSAYWMGWMTGSAMGKYITAEMGGNANYGTLDMPAVPDCVTQGAAKDLAIPYYAPNAKEVARASTLVEDEAYSYTENMMMAHPDINTLTNMNDDPTYGQIGALEVIGRDDVKIFGVGDQIHTMELIKQGSPLEATNDNNATQGSALAAELVVKTLLGETSYKYNNFHQYYITPENTDYWIAERHHYEDPAKAALPVAPRAGMVKKIGYSLPDSNNEFWTNISEGIDNWVSENSPGVSVEVTDAGGSSSTQIADIRQMINDGCETIIIAPIDASALANVVQEAKSKGVFTVGFNMTPPFYTYDIENNPRLTGAPQLETDVVFMTNTAWRGQMLGRSVANYISDNMGGKAKIATIQNPSDLGVVDIMDWAKEITKRHAPDAKFVAEATATTEANARDTMSQIIGANPDVGIVIASNEEIAYGVVTALEAAGRNDVKVWTIGDNDRTLELVKTGKIYCTCPIVSNYMGREAGEAALHLAEGIPVEYAWDPVFDEVTQTKVDWYLSMR